MSNIAPDYMDGWNDGFRDKRPADRSNEQYMEGYRTGKDDHRNKEWED